MTQLIAQFEQALLSLDQITTKEILRQGMENSSPLQFVEQVVVPALEQIGDGWESGDVALSQIYMSGRICEKLVDTILPPKDPQRKYQPKMAITVLEDYHLLGKRIVYSILRASGYEVLDYRQTDVNGLIQQVKKDDVKILLISTLMLPSALRVKNVRKSIPNSIKIIVGGAPFLFDDDLWKEVGADAMAKSASESIAVINNIMEEIA